MFGISIACFVLLIIIAIKIDAFSIFSIDAMLSTIILVIQNTYFSSIVCSIIAVLIIYFAQVSYSKKMLKKDFRCNEIIEVLYSGIELYCKIMDEIPERTERKSDENVDERRKKDAINFYEYYKRNKADVDIITLSLSYKNNDILIDSLQSCFFINLNFKLLNILNNIKNRLPNLRESYPIIKKIFEKYELENDEKELLDLGIRLPTYLVDLRFMSMYWKQLLDYLGYDPTYIKLFIQAYRSKYPFDEDIRQPIEVRNLRAKEIDKIVKRTLWINQIKHFFGK